MSTTLGDKLIQLANTMEGLKGEELHHVNTLGDKLIQLANTMEGLKRNPC